jgi:nucleoside-diphosphate kinase
VERRVVGEILRMIEQAGFTIAAARVVRMSREQAEGFYAVHRERPFFGSLTGFMSSGPCIPMVLEADGAIARLRDLMGATDPARAAEGTIRRLFGTSVERNAIHGSDGPATAAAEIRYFFSDLEIAGSV